MSMLFSLLVGLSFTPKSSGIWRLEILSGSNHRSGNVAFSPDGRYLATTGTHETKETSRGFAVLWDVKRRKIIRTIESNDLWLYSLGFSPDSRQLAAGAHGNNVYVWRVPDGRLIRMLQGDTYGNRVYAVKYSSDGSRLAGACYHGFVEIWNPHTGKLIRKIEGGHRCFDVAFSPGGREIAFGSDGLTKKWPAQWTGYADIWNARSGRLLRTMNPDNPGEQTDVPNSVAYSTDGKLLAVGTQCSLRLWRVRDGKLVRNLALCAKDIHSYQTVAFAPNGRSLAAGSIDGSITIWDVRTLRKRRVLRHRRGSVWNLSYSPDGRILAASVSEKRRSYVALWHIPQSEWLR